MEHSDDVKECKRLKFGGGHAQEQPRYWAAVVMRVSVGKAKSDRQSPGSQQPCVNLYTYIYQLDIYLHTLLFAKLRTAPMSTTMLCGSVSVWHRASQDTNG